MPPIFFGSGYFLVRQSPKTKIRKSGIKFLPPNQFLIFFQNPFGIPDIFLWLKGNLAILALMVLMGIKVLLRVRWHQSISNQVRSLEVSIWNRVTSLGDPAKGAANLNDSALPINHKKFFFRENFTWHCLRQNCNNFSKTNYLRSAWLWVTLRREY